MNKKIVTLPATIESIATRVDNTIKLVVSTQELPPDEAAMMFELKGKLGYMLFSENHIEEQDIPEEVAPEFKTDKTPSQRLRATLYIWWQQNTAMTVPFNQFYNDRIEAEINKIKGQLQ